MLIDVYANYTCRKIRQNNNKNKGNKKYEIVSFEDEEDNFNKTK